MGRGRPPKREDERHESIVYLRLTKAEKERLVQVARNSGMSLSDTVKMALAEFGVI